MGWLQTTKQWLERWLSVESIDSETKEAIFVEVVKSLTLPGFLIMLLSFSLGYMVRDVAQAWAREEATQELLEFQEVVDQARREVDSGSDRILATLDDLKIYQELAQSVKKHLDVSAGPAHGGGDALERIAAQISSDVELPGRVAQILLARHLTLKAFRADATQGASPPVPLDPGKLCFLTYIAVESSDAVCEITEQGSDLVLRAQAAECQAGCLVLVSSSD